MPYGKTIELFLVDGHADGVITAELSNWDGKVIKMPRIDVKSSTRTEVKQAGVYFLICENKEVYIGEAENIQDRLNIHINDYNSGKETYYWATVIFFVSKDKNYLNKSLIRYLENKLVNIAKEAGKFTVLTKNTYKNTVLKESQIASMDEFVDNIKILIKAMGYPILDVPENKDSIKTIFYCKGNNADAKGYPSDTGFTVIKGSKISDHIVPSFRTNVVAWFDERTKIESDGTVVDGLFTKDYVFTSPSAASAIVLGRPSNGNQDWKLSDGTMLKDIK